MLALCVAFALVLTAGWYMLVAPVLKSYSASIAQTTVDAAAKLKNTAFEFCDGEGDDLDGSGEEPTVASVLVLYATEYGFAREVARKTSAFLARRHVDVGPAVEFPANEKGAVILRPRIMNMLDFSAVDFSKEGLVLMIVSTTGDGVPPNEAEEFRDAMKDGSVVLPENLKYAVLALGDTGYPHFCRGGILFEELVHAKAGSAPIMERVNVDQEDWDTILAWIGRAYDVAQALLQKKAADSSRDVVQGAISDAVRATDYLCKSLEDYANSQNEASSRFSRANPYTATLKMRSSLCIPCQDIAEPKSVIRVEIAVDPEKISYTPGDAVGILPQNNLESVARLLQVLASNGDELVIIDGVSDPLPLEEALMERLDLRVIRVELIVALAEIATGKLEKTLARHLLVYAPESSSATVVSASLSEEGREYVAERHVIDLLTDFPSAQMPVQTLVRFLRPLHARYYSISSSPKKNNNIIAATLDVVRYQTRGVHREGVASTYLNDRMRLDGEVKIFVSKNANFRLPVDAARPVVMIGPGTGIAPFVAFIEEREVSEASGRNLLFFGCRHARHDFLYKKRLEQWAKDGILELVTAFSRDTEEKVYVTHRILEMGEEICKLLLDDMAHLYVCGDGSQMAKDVHEALKSVIEMHGNRSAEEADQFLDSLAANRRYQRDVWVS